MKHKIFGTVQSKLQICGNLFRMEYINNGFVSKPFLTNVQKRHETDRNTIYFNVHNLEKLNLTNFY